MLKIATYDKTQLINSLRGFIVYSIGDLVAQIILHDISLIRTLGLAFIGSTLYAIEIPIWFRIIETSRFHFKNSNLKNNFFFTKSKNTEYKFSAISKMSLAVLYFNPLWIARHMFFIQLFLFIEKGGSFNIIDTFSTMLPIATMSFLTNIIVVIAGNYIIQNKLNLKFRFIGSAIFSALLAIYYAVSIVLFK